MEDNQLLRYSRQILLPQIDVVGQTKLAQSTAFIIGLGGLGSPVAMYLAAAGVGNLILADNERVELSNLQRQILHDTTQLGEYKTLSAKIKLQQLNPNIHSTLLTERLEVEQIEQQVAQADVVVDCSDNFSTRYAVNAACVKQKIPLVSGAAVGLAGQVAVFIPTVANSPCYYCLYPDQEEECAETCSQAGVLGPLVGVIGSIQAVEAIKVLLNIGNTLCGRLLLFDGETFNWRIVKLPKDPQCPVCSAHSLNLNFLNQ